MNKQGEIITIGRETTGALEYREFNTSAELSAYFWNAARKKGAPRLSIAIMSHRNLASVKNCVESVLKYAQGIDYELVLMDNASEDGDETFNYLLSVEHERKKVIRMKDNMGPYFNAARGWSTLWSHCGGDYILHLNDDHIVTENAVQNMVRALDEDLTVGMVNPMSSQAWMMQNPGLPYTTWEEMFEAAKAFNVYNPRKWEERIYVAAVAWMFRREVLHCLSCANPFGPELSYDIALRLAGYRVMLLGDTWVHHDHDYSIKESYGFVGESPEKIAQREYIARSISHLTFGLTMFEDICVFEKQLVSLIAPPKKQTPELLCVDVRAGQGLLDLKNALRSHGVFSCRSTAFSTQAKYYPLLYTIADDVLTGKIESIQETLNGRMFDYIIVGTPINFYENRDNLVSILHGMLHPGGELLYKLRDKEPPYLEMLYKSTNP